MSEGEPTPEPGYLLGGILIALLVLPQAAAFQFEVPAGLKEGPGAVFVGVYLQMWGLMFLAAYYFSHKTFFFRGLMWICEHLSHPRGRGMAFFYFGLAFLLGTLSMLKGLGVR